MHLRKKLFFLLSLIIIFFVAALIVTYFSSRTILKKQVEENLVSSMDTFFTMLETNYKGVKGFRDKETQIVKKQMMTSVDELYDYADKYYQKVAKKEMTLQEARDAVWKHFLTVKIGSSGYVYILKDDGTCLLHPKEGVAGINWGIIPEKQYDFIRWQMKKVRGYTEYMWANPEEIHPREKSIAQRYFKPFDWIISLSAYRNEFSNLVDMSFSQQSKMNIEQAVMNLKLGKTGYAFCMSPDYVLLLHPDAAGKNVKNSELGRLLADPANAERSRKETVVLYYPWQNPGESKPSQKIMAYRYFAPYDWIVGMTAYPKDLTGDIYAVMIRTGAATMLILLLFSVMLMLFLTKGIVSPIEKLTSVIEKYVQGDFQIRADIRRSDEIGFLADKFNSMLDQLQSAQQQLINIIDFLPDATLVIDKDHKVIAWNRAIEEMTGIRKEEIIGKGDYCYSVPFYGERKPILIDFTLEPIEDMESNYSNIGRKGNVLYGEAFVPNLYNGRSAYLWGTAAPLFDGKGNLTGAIETLRDITERKKAEAEVRRLNEGLEQRVGERTAELEAFSYSLSHDLTTPLRAIDGFSNILLEEYKSFLPVEASKYLQMVRKNTQYMGKLLSDLLAFMLMSRHAIQKETVNPADIVRQVLDDLQYMQEGRKIKLVIGDLPECQSDPRLLRIVYANLLSNALKFTQPRDQAQIIISCRQDNGENVYYVRDNGVGFNMQFAHKLFNVFQRLHRLDEFDGSGVGLAIANKIISGHGGRIWTEAKLNEGATFYFTISK